MKESNFDFSLFQYGYDEDNKSVVVSWEKEGDAEIARQKDLDPSFDIEAFFTEHITQALTKAVEAEEEAKANEGK